MSCLKARSATKGLESLMFVAVAPEALIYLSAPMRSGYASGQMIAELARIDVVWRLISQAGALRPNYHDPVELEDAPMRKRQERCG